MKLKLTFSVLLFLCYVNVRAQPGNALDFDGTNDLVAASSVPSFFSTPASNDFTIEAWIYPRASVFGRIVFAQASTSNFVSFGTGAGNVIYFYVIVNGTTYSIATSTGIALNQWTHVAARWTAASNALAVFYNGVLQTGAAGGTSSSGSNGMSLGGRTNGAQYFSGAVDELRIWSEARSDCNILLNMNNSITGTLPNLAVNYHFDHGTAGGTNTGVTTLTDFSGNLINGTLSNFALTGTTSNWIASTATINTAGGPATGPTTSQTLAICSGSSYTFPDGTTQNNITAPLTQTSTGCQTVITSLTIKATPTISVNSGTICAGQPFVITPSGASTYTVQGGNFTLAPNVSGSYTVTGTGITGCVAQQAATSSIVVNANPTIAVNSGTICEGQTFTITPSGAVTYTIDGGSNHVSPVTGTSYTVLGTNAAGCVSPLPATSDVFVNASPVITVNSGNICEGKTFTMMPGGATSYTVQGGSYTVSPAATTSYTISGTSAEGCMSLANALATVSVSPNPTVVITGATITCIGTVMNLGAAGADTYLWSTGSTSQSITVLPSATTVYSLTGTYANSGCSSKTVLTLSAVFCTGIAQVNYEAMALHIYPNPGNGNFFIELPVDCEVTITDIVGRIVYSEKCMAGENKISLGNVAKGIYNVTALSNAQSSTCRIVVGD